MNWPSKLITNPTLSLFVFLLFDLAPIYAQMPSPQAVFGFQMGADRKLVDWKEITHYFEMLDRSTERVQVVEFGKSTEGRPMIMAVITSAQNFRRMPDILRIQAALADPRKMPKDSLENFVQRGRAIVMLSCSIHSTEIAASQMSLELAHHLTSKNDTATLEILNNVVTLLVPSPNPDGIQLVVDWYEKQLGTPYEGSAPPWLYQSYAGHDNNRDWFMLNLAETRALTALLYHKWFPQIVYDLHQMGRNGPRFVIPPFYEVSHPNIDPLILREIMMIGGHMSTDLAAAGFTGIATEAIYDMWWHGGMRTAPYYHNTVGLLSEAASVKIATPITLRPEELTSAGRGLQNVREFQTNFPEPWPGGAWRLRDIVDLNLTACNSVLTLAARYRDLWLRNFYHVGLRAINKGRQEQPAAYLIPREQTDPAAAQKMLDILLWQGTEILRARESFVAEGMRFPAGACVIDLRQPYRANIVTLMEKQNYPIRRSSPEAAPERPYDVTGWTLPLQMGVEVMTLEKSLDVAADTMNFSTMPSAARIFFSVESSHSNLSEAQYYLFSSSNSDAYRLVNRLFDKGKSIYWNTKAFSDQEQAYPAGQFLVPRAQLQANELKKLAGDLTLAVVPVTSSSFPAQRLQQPRVAVYRSYVPAEDEGWTRYVLDDFAFKHQTLWDADLRAGDFAEKFDAIIIPDQADSVIRHGHIAQARDNRQVYPPEFCGGLGQAGLRNLRRFVESGGSLLVFDSATKLFIDAWALPAVNVLESLKGSQFSAPGSILRGLVGAEHPVIYGLPREVALFFANSPAFKLYDREAVSLMAYPQQNPLLSGWLQGHGELHGKTALAEIPLGRGRVVLFGFRPQHRGQTWGTFKLVFNSLLYAAAEISTADNPPSSVE